MRDSYRHHIYKNNYFSLIDEILSHEEHKKEMLSKRWRLRRSQCSCQSYGTVCREAAEVLQLEAPYEERILRLF